MERARQHVSSGSPWEILVGYCRAVRVGDLVAVAGTAPQMPDGQVDPDPEAQARRCLEIIQGALIEAGGDLADVVRTRIYLTDARDFDAVARAHAAAFSEVRPANTTVVVARLLDERWKVEIEADAVISTSRDRSATG
ncbi:MAG: RidA family protein [Acidimicrobiales bacterium]|nr:RidA family protein [Acidimicrobiales bacterium]